MARVPATEFKAKCLELMDHVAERRATYVITKRGRPVAKLVPADPPKGKTVFGCMADDTEIVGDPREPLWTEAQWKTFERERSDQARAWEREWTRRETGAGNKTVRQPARGARRKNGLAKRRSRPRR
jgi:prevent-host-death family protein